MKKLLSLVFVLALFLVVGAGCTDIDNYCQENPDDVQCNLGARTQDSGQQKKSDGTNTYIDVDDSVDYVDYNGADLIDIGSLTATTGTFNVLLATSTLLGGLDMQGNDITDVGTLTATTVSATTYIGLSPGGSTTQIQYNNAGAFGGASGLIWNNTNKEVGIETTGTATAGTTTYDSSILQLHSSGWDVNDAVARDIGWRTYVDPSSSNAPYGSLLFEYNNDAGGAGTWSPRMTLNNALNALELTAGSTSAINGYGIAWNDSGNNRSNFYPDYSKDQFVFLIDDVAGNQFVLGNQAGYGQDFDHAITTNPTWFIHSDIAPDVSNNQWLSFTHNQAGGVITTGNNTGAGTGATTIDNYLSFQPRGTEYMRLTGSGDLGINTSTPAFDLHVAGGTTTSTIGIGVAGTKAGCLAIQDTDLGGWTYCTTLNGTMTCGTSSCE